MCAASEQRYTLGALARRQSPPDSLLRRQHGASSRAELGPGELRAQRLFVLELAQALAPWILPASLDFVLPRLAPVRWSSHWRPAKAPRRAGESQSPARMRIPPRLRCRPQTSSMPAAIAGGARRAAAPPAVAPQSGSRDHCAARLPSRPVRYPPVRQFCARVTYPRRLSITLLSFSRSICRARKTRVLTVASATPSTSAASGAVSSSIAERVSASRKSCGSEKIA